MSNTELEGYVHALRWYLDAGVTAPLSESSSNHISKSIPNDNSEEAPLINSDTLSQNTQAVTNAPSSSVLLGKNNAQKQSIELCNNVSNLKELQDAIQNFDGLPVKKTATNMVFATGNPHSHLMLIGEAPGAEEDRLGLPFVGKSGKLLDKILNSVGIDRNNDLEENSIYITNILNWRPPGNRTPSQTEIDISLPFIEKHIQLVYPKLIIFCGSVAAKALMGTDDNISKIRGKIHQYKPSLIDNSAEDIIPSIATYHPSYLLRTPIHKKSVWNDMLVVRETLESFKTKENSDK
jgi:DNA polymerase